MSDAEKYSLHQNTKVVISVSLLVSSAIAALIGAYQLGSTVRDRDTRLIVLEEKSVNQQRQLGNIQNILQELKTQAHENAQRLERIEKAVR